MLVQLQKTGAAKLTYEQFESGLDEKTRTVDVDLVKSYPGANFCHSLASKEGAPQSAEDCASESSNRTAHQAASP
uniref:Uncharacterized protein n=1 Tax=Plectus sambesii TaxID=2011161 RepID=A0A914WC12_9BILA